MAIPLYFDPDPEIEDSDLLGYGNLVFNDGSTQFVNGDPMVAQQLPRNAQERDIMAGLQTQPPELPQGVEVNQDGSITTPQGTVQGGELHPANPDASAPAVDYLRGLDAASQANRLAPKMSHDAPPSAADGRGQDIQKLLDTPTSVEQRDIMAGLNTDPPPLPQGVTINQDGSISTPHGTVSNGELVPYQREGALPPELAQQQRSDLLQQQDATLAAAQTARENEVRITREAALKRQGEIMAEMQAERERQQEQRAKQDRLYEERQAVEKADIAADIYDAKGDVGGVFAVVGAALMALGGNAELGQRMIDSAVDRKVKENLVRRDSALHRLDEQLGNTQQAIAAGKAAHYKLAAEKAEQTVLLTKADIYEAHSPEVIQALKQKSLEELQKFDQLSLGKTIERAPAGAKGPTAAQQRGYGEASAAQRQGEQDLYRALRAIGGVYDPKSGKITNRDQIIKEGINGVGDFDTFIQGLGRVPILGNAVTAADTAFTSDKGKEVRAALGALVEARAAMRNPGRAPTDADREAAKTELGLNSERGVVDAIERLLNQQDQVRDSNVATYGTQAAAAVEGTYRQQGGGKDRPGETPQVMMLEPGRAREQMRLQRSQQPKAPAEQPAAELTPEQRMGDLAAEVQTVAGNELPPEGLRILVAQAALESGNGDSEGARHNNFFGHKATGKNPSFESMTNEGEGEATKRMRLKFADYPTAAAAVQDHIGLLKRRYPDAWDALAAGDEAAYVAALKDGGYFTANETEYLNGLRRAL